MLTPSRSIFTFAVCFTAFFFMAQPATAERTVLHRGNVAEPDTLDPHKMTGTWEFEICADLFQGLLDYDENAELIPGAAKSWEITDDGLHYTFHMREGLVWSDGEPLTAHDYVAGMRRLMDPKTTAPGAPLFYAIKNGQEVNTGAMPVDALGVSAPDELTVVVDLARPSPGILRGMNDPRTSPLPRHIYAKHGEDWMKPENIVSNGAFTLVDWRPYDYVHVIKNPLFQEAKQVALTDVYYHPIMDTGAALKSFRAGELDLNTDFPTQQFEFLNETMPGQAVANAALASTFLSFNHTRVPFNDRRVRQALTIAVDRHMITDRIKRLGEEAANGMVPSIMPDYIPVVTNWELTPIEERRATARALLAEAGFTADNPLRFEYSVRSTGDNPKVAVALRAMWQEIGVQVTINATESKVHYDKLAQNNFDMGDMGWQGSPSPEVYLFLMSSSAAELNSGDYTNDAFDAKLLEGLNTANITERNRLMAEAEKIALNDYAIIPLYYGVNKQLIGSHIRGYQNNVLDAHASRFIRIAE